MGTGFVKPTGRHAQTGVSFGEEGGEHKEHTQMGVFLVFEGMGRVREATNT